MSGSILEIINKLGVFFCEHALKMLIQSSILIAALFIIDLILRKRIKAVLRYCIWLLVFVKLVTPTTLSLPTGIFYWLGDLLPAKSAPKEIIQLPQAEYFIEPLIQPRLGFINGGVEPHPTYNAHTPVTEEPVTTPAAPSIKTQAVFFLVWIVGELILVSLLLQRTFFVRRIIAQSKPAESKLQDILNDSCRKISIRKKIELKVSKSLLSPAACGLVKPRIILPSSLLKSFSLEKLRTTMLHELAHIKRKDIWVNSLQTFLQIFYFYNPLLWIANIIVRRIREQAVDETVLVYLGERADTYSSTLVDIAEIAFAKPSLGLNMIGVVESKKALTARIKHILSHPFPKTVKLGVTGLAAIILAAFVLLPMAKAQKETVAPEESDAIRKAKYNEVGEYIKGIGQYGRVTYNQNHGVITKGEVPILHELLDNDEYAPNWNIVVLAIGYFSDDPDSVNVLLKYIQRNDNKKLDQLSYVSKISAFIMIGLIGGDTADSILRKSITKDGARELTKDWIDEPMPNPFRTKLMIDMIQAYSLQGLVLTGKLENLALVEKLYNEEKEISIKNHKKTEFMSGLIDAMAKKDYIAEAGLETALNKSDLFSIYPYLKKYSFDLNEADSAEPVRKAKYNEVAEYIKKNGQTLGQAGYGETRKVLTKYELPILYELLDNDEYALYWNMVVKAIGFIGDDPDSVNVLLKFIRKNDNKKLGMFSPYSKASAFAMIGLIGGDTADSILRKSVTKEGIRELTKDWIDQPLPSPFDAKVMIELMQKSALDGLVLRGKLENLAFLDKLYNEQKEISKKNHKNTELMPLLIEAMSAKDYITQEGFESYMSKTGVYKLPALSPYINKYRFSLNEEESPEAVRKVKFNHVTEIITKNGQMGQVRYDQISEVITKDELPILYELLDNDEYAPYWNQVVTVIGQVSDDPNTINILLKFIQRDDNNKLDRHSSLSKINAFAAISKVGGDLAESILRKAATKEGVRELTKSWIDKPLPEPRDIESVIAMIQRSSLSGLLKRAKPEDLALIEKLYNEEKVISIKNHKITRLMFQLMEVMAEKDRIAAVGLETYQNMSSQRRAGDMDQYDMKYFSDLADAGLLDPGIKEFLKTISEKDSAAK